MKKKLQLGSCFLLALMTSAAHAATPAIDGTVASNSLGALWREWAVGGIQNRSSGARDWLMALSTELCFDPTPCAVSATFKGGATGNSTAIAYAVGHNGFLIAATPSVSAGGTLVTQFLGNLNISDSSGFVLLVTNLAGASSTGGTNGGVMASGQLD
jgi:hypothetical protein